MEIFIIIILAMILFGAFYYPAEFVVMYCGYRAPLNQVCMGLRPSNVESDSLIIFI